jgi:phosphoribosylanthranilate isomerase
MRAGREGEVKICGITRQEDACLAVELGARFIGLNFYPGSPRALAPERARAIADSVRGRAAVVGVFVNRPAAEVRAIDAEVGLDLLQFHGDEAPADLAPWGGRAMKAFRTGGDVGGVRPQLFPAAWGFLFDLHHPTLYGGTGEGWPYEALSALALDRPFFVAGGIRPGNARRALEASGAFGLDVCSGVESAPGVKDRALLERLFGEVLGHG